MPVYPTKTNARTPALFASPAYLPMRQHLTLLHEAHSFRLVVTVGHFPCRYYGKRYARLDTTDRRRRALSDLQQFKANLGRLVPGVSVETFFAEPAEDHIQFLGTD